MKTSRQLKRLIKNESAQALVETMIVLPVVIFFILGIIQLTLMHQARLMLEYAAFNAARTGSVWNANPARMRMAALLSMIASRPGWPHVASIGQIDDYGEMAMAAVQLISMGKATGAVEGWITAVMNLLGSEDSSADLGAYSLIKVAILSPTQEDANGAEEIDFDAVGTSFDERKKGQLSIRVTYFYKLFIPFANWLIWQSWYTSRAAGLWGTVKFMNWWNAHTPAELHLNIRSKSPFLAFDGRKWATHTKLLQLLLNWGANWSNPYECLTQMDWATLVSSNLIGNESERYYIPLVTAHTIRMQSNAYRDNLPTAAEASCSN